MAELASVLQPLAQCGIKFFQARLAAIGRESWTRSILVTNSASLSKASRPLTPQVALNSSHSSQVLKTPVSRRAMPRPSGPPLLVACYDGRVEDVRKLLAAGADPRLPCGDQRISWRLCIFNCIHFGYADVLEALLATGHYELVHQVQNVIPRSAQDARKSRGWNADGT